MIGYLMVNVDSVGMLMCLDLHYFILLYYSTFLFLHGPYSSIILLNAAAHPSVNLVLNCSQVNLSSKILGLVPFEIYSVDLRAENL